MTDTPNLKLPYLLAAQAQKHVTLNETLRALDCVVQLSVLDRNLVTPPDSPAEGARYIVENSPSGAWAGQSGKIAAFQDGAWMFYAPKEGWLTWVADENALVVYDGAVWSALPASGGGGGTSDHGLLTGLGDDDHPQYLTNTRGDARYAPLAPATLGVNATADATNRLSVNSAASLFNHSGNGGHQLKLNKAAAADTASFLFQTGFSGRAEIGTTGDDNLHVKVSADGNTYREAISVSAATGNVGIGTPAANTKLSISCGHTDPSASAYTGGMWIGDQSGYTNSGLEMGSAHSSPYGVWAQTKSGSGGAGSYPLCLQPLGGNVGIGTQAPAYRLHLAADSAAKPGTNTWTVSSDERLKEDIRPADLERCWEIVKTNPLYHFGWKPDAYTDSQIADRHQLGWIAQKTQKVFKNSVVARPFTMADGTTILADCLQVNHDQLYAAMYGALQSAIRKIEALQVEVVGLRHAKPG